MDCRSFTSFSKQNWLMFFQEYFAELKRLKRTEEGERKKKI